MRRLVGRRSNEEVEEEEGKLNGGQTSPLEPLYSSDGRIDGASSAIVFEALGEGVDVGGVGERRRKA